MRRSSPAGAESLHDYFCAYLCRHDPRLYSLGRSQGVHRRRTDVDVSFPRRLVLGGLMMRQHGFMLMGIIIGIVGMTDRSKMATTIISGIGDMVSVNVVIALACATAVLMSQTGLGSWMVQGFGYCSDTTRLRHSSGSWITSFILVSASWCRLLPAWPRFPHRLFSPIVSGLNGRWRPSIEATLQPMVSVNLFTTNLRLHYGRSCTCSHSIRDMAQWAAKLGYH